MKRENQPKVKNQGDAAAHRPDFDDLAFLPARRVQARPAEYADLDGLIGIAQRLIPPLAAARPAIERVYRHNPDSIWAVHGRDGLCGAFAMLILNEIGYRSLMTGRFNAADPQPQWLTRRGEHAAAIYLWAIATPGFAVDAFRTVSLWLQAPAYAHADIFTKTTTNSGARFAANIGFEPVPETGLLRFQRHRNRSETAIAVA